jgi:hypothetical protein
VRRERDVHDNRLRLLRLTEEGEQIAEHLQQHMSAAHATLFERLTPHEQAARLVEKGICKGTAYTWNGGLLGIWARDGRSGGRGMSMWSGTTIVARITDGHHSPLLVAV